MLVKLATCQLIAKKLSAGRSFKKLHYTIGSKHTFFLQEINNNIKEGYKKGINRPPKELVFNALNSTKLDKVI